MPTAHIRKVATREAIEISGGIFLKGTNFDAVNDDEINQAQVKINKSPMKLHKWRSPAEIAPLLVAA